MRIEVVRDVKWDSFKVFTAIQEIWGKSPLLERVAGMISCMDCPRPLNHEDLAPMIPIEEPNEPWKVGLYDYSEKRCPSGWVWRPNGYYGLVSKNNFVHLWAPNGNVLTVYYEKDRFVVYVDHGWEKENLGKLASLLGVKVEK